MSTTISGTALNVATITSPTLITPIINGMGSSILTSGTAVASTSGTSIDFTGIPSWVKRITVMFNGVSTSSSSDIIIRIGATTVPETSGYLGAAVQVASSAGVVASNATDNGFCVAPAVSNTTIFHGSATITLMTGSTWVSASTLARSDATSSIVGAGSKTITGTLGVVRLTTVNGTDTFDAGSINILYE